MVEAVAQILLQKGDAGLAPVVRPAGESLAPPPFCCHRACSRCASGSSAGDGPIAAPRSYAASARGRPACLRAQARPRNRRPICSHQPGHIADDGPPLCSSFLRPSYFPFSCGDNSFASSSSSLLINFHGRLFRSPGHAYINR